jgi:SAM-dependent methyltransferase
MLVGGPLPEADFLRTLKAGSDDAGRQFALLKRCFTPRTVFMHVDAAECALALQAASYVERVYAIDPLESVRRSYGSGARLPCNLQLVYTAGNALPVAQGTVDVAFSSELATERLAQIRRALVAGGRYIFSCTLRTGAVRRALRAAGFSEVRFPWFEPVVEAVKP